MQARTVHQAFKNKGTIKENNWSRMDKNKYNFIFGYFNVGFLDGVYVRVKMVCNEIFGFTSGNVIRDINAGDERILIL